MSTAVDRAADGGSVVVSVVYSAHRRDLQLDICYTGDGLTDADLELLHPREGRHQSIGGAKNAAVPAIMGAVRKTSPHERTCLPPLLLIDPDAAFQPPTVTAPVPFRFSPGTSSAQSGAISRHVALTADRRSACKFRR